MCGGEIDVLILPVLSSGERGFDSIIIQKIEALQTERRPFMLLVHLSELRFGHTCILENDGGKIDSNAAEWIGRDQFSLLEEMSRTETSGIIETQTGKIYVDVEKPAPRLIVIGAVHTAMALVAMAKQLEFTQY
jgi:xanthine/CO dehydrogenase XdhC/CoxF family maturation factor